MGLLDIWDDWRKKQEGSWSARDDFSAMDSDLRTPPKNIYDNNWNKVKNYVLGDEKQKGPQQIRDKSQLWSDVKKTGKKIYEGMPGGDYDKKWAIDQANKNKINAAKINAAKTNNAIPFHPSQGGTNQNLAQEDLTVMEKLAKWAHVDMDKAMANWKEKGGFEGLMANPAFTMGLAFMQAGAEGKTLGAGALDNVMKAGGISQHYKKIIENRSGDVIETTEGMMKDIKGVLGEMNISGPGWRKMLPGNQSASYEQAVEDISMKVQTKIKAMKKDAKASGKDIVVGKRLKKKIIQEMIDSGEINTKRVFFDKTLETKAQGGPVQAGKPYVVGEKGPEVIIPRSDGNVLANDDSQIFAMLLASNPQLQNVSKQRAERILRSRFPEYFEG